MIPEAIKRWRRETTARQSCEHKYKVVVGPGVTECSDCGSIIRESLHFPKPQQTNDYQAEEIRRLRCILVDTGKEHRNETDQLKAEIKRLQARVKDWIGVAAKIANDPEKDRLKRSLRAVEAERDELRRGASELKSEIGYYADEIETYERRAKETTSELANLRDEVQALRNNNAQEELQVTALAGRIERLARWIDQNIGERSKMADGTTDADLRRYVDGQVSGYRQVREFMRQACTTRPATQIEITSPKISNRENSSVDSK